jgi:hypothetical protein
VTCCGAFHDNRALTDPCVPTAEWATPVQVFHKAAGFYMYYDDANLFQKMKTWNVLPIAVRSLFCSPVTSSEHLCVSQVPKDRRHLDYINQREIWKRINHFIMTSKPGWATLQTDVKH